MGLAVLELNLGSSPPRVSAVCSWRPFDPKDGESNHPFAVSFDCASYQRRAKLTKLTGVPQLGPLDKGKLRSPVHLYSEVSVSSPANRARTRDEREGNSLPFVPLSHSDTRAYKDCYSRTHYTCSMLRAVLSLPEKA